MKHSFIATLIFGIFVVFIPKKAVSQCSYSQVVGKPSLITNGNFDGGNTGFTCGYTYTSGQLLSENLYTINTDAASTHWAFTGYDHTSGNGTGKFMILNGSASPTFVWNQTVSVTPNTYYNFSAWFKNIVIKPTYAGSPIATVELWINGVKISKTLPLIDYPDVWVQLDTFWYSGSSTTANLSIKNIGTSLGGNDFAIDDIAFISCCGFGRSTSLTTCSGIPVQLDGTGSGSISWSPTSGLSNSTISNPTANPLATTQYILTRTSGTCITWDTFLVNIISVAVNAGPDSVICQGDSIRLAGSGLGTLKWKYNTTLSDSTVSNPYAKPVNPTTTYILSATNGTCVSYDTVRVTISTGSVFAGSDFTFCTGDSVTLNGSATGTFYWSPGSRMADSTVLNPKVLGTAAKYVLIKKAGNCYFSDTVQITPASVTSDAGPAAQICRRQLTVLIGSGTAGASYSWLPIKNISNNLTLNPTVNPDTTTTYYLTVSLGTCRITDSVVVTVDPLNAIIHTNDTTICPGDTVSLSGYANYSPYSWITTNYMSGSGTLQPKVFPPSAMRYYLEVNNGTCIIRDSIDIAIKSIQADAGADQAICAGDTIQFNAANVLNGSFTWKPASIFTDPLIQNPKAYPATNTTVYLTVSSGKCVDTDTVEIAVNSSPIADAGSDKIHCFEDSVSLSGSVTGATSFAWIPVTGLSNPGVLNPKARAIVYRTYVLEAVNGSCKDYDTVLVTENPKVTAAFSMNPIRGIAPVNVQFTNESVNANHYLWSFGDTSLLDTNKSPSNVYYAEGRFPVKLIAIDELGCSDTAEMEMIVSSDTYFWLPNVFTPNGDLLNDRFEIICNIDGFEFVRYWIYNRWGDLLYETKFPGGAWWDGKFKGVECPESVYFYIAEGKAINGKMYKASGTVTLLR